MSAVPSRLAGCCTWYCSPNKLYRFFINSAAGRTILDFPLPDGIESLWPLVEEWAGQNGFRLRESGAARRRYVKANLLQVPICLDIVQEGVSVHLEAWVKSTAPPMSTWSYIMADEMVLESGNLVGVAPRSVGRKAVNKLLARLSQPPIK